MLKEECAAEFVALCEDCEEASPPIVGSQEMAILRLMRMRWRLRTGSSGTRTWCPHCHTSPSITPLRAHG